MTETPNEAALKADFQFEALNMAENYRQAILREFSISARGDVLEVGAGIGQNTAHLIASPDVKKTVSVEPNAGFCSEFRKRLPGQLLVQGTVDTLGPAAEFDSIVSINVLEHIRDDVSELAAYRQLLAARKGRLCLFVPARPEIYAPLDKDFGHHRRYLLEDLRTKLQQAGFHILRLHYFNFLGYFAWRLNFCLLKKRLFNRLAVRIYDRMIFPPSHLVERYLCRPRLGQSLLAVAASYSPNL